MQGDRCLSTACHALYNNVLIRQIPDDGILLLLDGSDDIAENRILILGQIFDQEVIIGGNIVIVIAVKLTIGNIIGTLLMKINLHII